ncbi:MAG: M20 family metallo-hydrolase [Odoribacter sp.]|nr:M20 family metallo-hydrolase [Odoribacter sp.]
MDAQQAIALLKRIISIPSFSKEENKVASLMESVWTEYGYKTNRKGNNVWVKSKYFEEGKPTLLFDAHIDTVKPNGNWKTDPFTPTEKEGRLYGLGSNDTGGSIVSMMAAFIQLDKKSQPFNMIYLSSAEEENTGKGGIQSVVEELGKIDLALIGEPTQMQAAIAEKGLMVLDCMAYGKSGHAAREEGVNAIYKALPDIEWFRTYQFKKESPLLGKVKMSVTGINAGNLHNVVPAECKFMVDIRVNEHYSNQEVFEIIKQHVESEIKPRSFSLNSSSISENHPIVQRCKKMGLRTYGSPTTSNQAVIPYTSLKIGPGDSARSHTTNEYIGLQEIEDGIRIFVELLDGLKL